MNRGNAIRWGLVLAFVLLLEPLVWAQAPGVLRGSVYDADMDIPIEKARITIVEALVTVTTDADGRFKFEGIPAGAYTLSITKAGFERATRRQVVVPPGQVKDIGSIELDPEVIDMPTMVVTGTDLLGDTELGILEIRADAIGVQDAISSEMFSKAGVGDVAEGIKLLPGVSVSGGKYATVRGLSDRYTGTTINGVRIPSADPRRRAVQVDLFPTGTVDSVTVSKTFLPNMQGDFTGGGVDIRTKSIPVGPILNFSVSGGYDSEATNNDAFLSYVGGGVPTFGFDHSNRDLAMRNPNQAPSLSSRPSEADIALNAQWDAFANSFAPAMGVTPQSQDLDRGFSLSVGNFFDVLGGKTLGLIGSVTYSQNNDFYENGQANRSFFNPNAGDLDRNPRTDTRGTRELLMGFLGTAVLQFNPDHELSFKVISNHAATDQARIEYTNRGANNEQQNQALRYVERTVGSGQFSGNHTLGRRRFEVDWTAAYNFTTQLEPDTRFFRNIFNNSSGGFTFPGDGSSLSEKTRRVFRDIEEDGYLLMGNATMPFRSWTGDEAKLMAGFYHEQTDRLLEQESFTYDNMRALCSRRFSWCREFLVSRQVPQAQNPGDLWTDFFTDPGRIGFPVDAPEQLPGTQLNWYPVPLSSDVTYDGNQVIAAAYAMVELPVMDRLTVTAGARLESTDIEMFPTADIDNQDLCPPVEIDPDCSRPGTLEVLIEDISRDADGNITNISRGIGFPFVASGEGDADIDEQQLLPAVTAIYDLTSDMKLRASWSKTIARPTFREISRVATIEALQGDEFVGNKDLKLSEIKNYDLRWEWFPNDAPGDLLAFSLFYKEIKNPIEFVGIGVSSRNFVKPENFDFGEVSGFEFEARTSLRHLRRGWLDEWRFLEDIDFGVNYTLLDSSVELNDVALFAVRGTGVTERALQGQPEYLANANISYDSEPLGTTISLFYNESGETFLTGLSSLVDNVRPDVVLLPQTSVGFKATKTLGEVMALSFKASNLTSDDTVSVDRAPTGQEEIRDFQKGASGYSLSASWKW